MPYNAVEKTVINKCVVLIASIKTVFNALITFIIGIKLVASDTLPTSIYIEAPPITVGISVKRLILSVPSFTVFALKESTLIIDAVKNAKTATINKNSKVCVADKPIPFVDAPIASSFKAKDIIYPPTDIKALKHTKMNTVIVFARYSGFLLI